MAASSVTGTGPGSAFPGNTLPNLEFLIQEEISKRLNKKYEVFYTRFVSNTEPNDAMPVDTEVDLTDDNEYLFGIVFNAANVPITDLKIYSAGFAQISNPSITIFGGILFSPDGGNNIVLIVSLTGGISHLERGGVQAVCCVPNSLYCILGNSYFGSITGSQRMYVQFGDTGSSAYFIAFRK